MIGVAPQNKDAVREAGGIGGGDLGYIADYVLQDRYIALVVDYGLRPVQDRWSIAVVDVAESKSAVLPLLPRGQALSGRKRTSPGCSVPYKGLRYHTLVIWTPSKS